MKVTFACPSGPRPVGGVTVLYEFANALSRRGHDVHLVHAPFFGFAIESLSDLGWFDFEPGIVHHVVRSPSPEFPEADIVFATGAPRGAGLQPRGHRVDRRSQGHLVAAVEARGRLVEQQQPR